MSFFRSLGAALAALVLFGLSAPALAQTIIPPAGGGGGGCSTTCTNTGLLTITPGANVGSLALTWNTTGSSNAKAISLTGTMNTTGAASGLYMNYTFTAGSLASAISINNDILGEIFKISAGTADVYVYDASKFVWNNRFSIRASAVDSFQWRDSTAAKIVTWSIANNQQVTVDSALVLPMRVVTAAGAVTVTKADQTVVVKKTTGAATTVNLPASPTTGETHTIKDGKGDAATNNITITPAAGTIDGAANLVISTNYGRATVVYNGTEWGAQ